jgi:hypothetical protein
LAPGLQKSEPGADYGANTGATPYVTNGADCVTTIRAL